MFSFLQKITPKRREGSSTSISTSKLASTEHINLVSNSSIGMNQSDLLPSSIDFSVADDLLQNFPSTSSASHAQSSGGKKSKENSSKKSTTSSCNANAASATNHMSPVASLSTEAFGNSSSRSDSNHETTTKENSHHHSKSINPFGKNSPFSRKSNVSLSSISSGYFTTGRFRDKSHKSSTSLGN